MQFKGFQFCSDTMPGVTCLRNIVPMQRNLEYRFFCLSALSFFQKLNRELAGSLHFSAAGLPQLAKDNLSAIGPAPVAVVDFPLLSSLLKEGRANKDVGASGPVYELDFSLQQSLEPMMPSGFFDSSLSLGAFVPAVAAAMAWEIEAFPGDDTDPRAWLEGSSKPADLFELDFSAVVFLGVALVPRLLSRSLKLVWERAVEPELPLIVLERDESRVNDFGSWKGAEGEPETSEWQIIPTVLSPSRELVNRGPLPVSNLLQMEYTWSPHKWPDCGVPEQLSVPLTDAAMLPGDLECPGISLTIALPPHLSSLPPLLCSSLLGEIEVQRCSLVTLELQMGSAVLPLAPVVLSADEKPFFFRVQIPPATLAEKEFQLEELHLVPAALPPASAPLRFADRVSAMDDDQFIACAQAETQRLIGYQDNGRGDIHHFLAMCAEFASHKALFEIADEESTAFVAPRPPSSAKKEKKAEKAVPALRPLSKRGRGGEGDALPVVAAVVVAAKSSADEEEHLRAKRPSFVVPAESLLNSYMKARNVDVKKRWDLHGFAAGDDAASTKAMALLDSGKRPVRLSHSSSAKSLLSVALLVAAKYAAREVAGCVVCVHEHLTVAQHHLALHAAVFSGVAFGDRIKPRSVVLVAEWPQQPQQLPPKSLLIVCGSDAFVRQVVLASDKQADLAMVCAVTGPCEALARFDIALDAVRIDFRPVALSDVQRALVVSVESAVSERLARLMADSPPPARLLSVAAVQRVLDGEEDPEHQAELLLVRISKAVADLLGSQAVSQARSFLQSCFAHPVYGAFVRNELADMEASLSFAADSVHPKQGAVLEELLSTADATVVLCEAWHGAWPWPNAKMIAARLALQDAMFPWNRVRRLVVLDTPGGWEAAEAIECVRGRSSGCTVTWLVTDYELTRSGPLLFWPSAPSAAQICSAFDLAFEWKMFLSQHPEGLEEAPLMASPELLVSSPNLMASLSSSLGLSLVLRGGMAVDLAVDEARCVLIRTLQGLSLEELCSAVYETSKPFPSL